MELVTSLRLDFWGWTNQHVIATSRHTTSFTDLLDLALAMLGSRGFWGRKTTANWPFFLYLLPPAVSSTTHTAVLFGYMVQYVVHCVQAWLKSGYCTDQSIRHTCYTYMWYASYTHCPRVYRYHWQAQQPWVVMFTCFIIVQQTSHTFQYIILNGPNQKKHRGTCNMLCYSLIQQLDCELPKCTCLKMEGYSQTSQQRSCLESWMKCRWDALILYLE